MTISKNAELNKFYLARDLQTGEYACEGCNTGMGTVIDRTKSISRAYRFMSPGEIQNWMGGEHDNPTG